jgi:hypothetical protein
MGLQAMAENRGRRVIEVAYEETRHRILASSVLSGLGGATARPATATG